MADEKTENPGDKARLLGICAAPGWFVAYRKTRIDGTQEKVSDHDVFLLPVAFWASVEMEDKTLSVDAYVQAFDGGLIGARRAKNFVRYYHESEGNLEEMQGRYLTTEVMRAWNRRKIAAPPEAGHTSDEVPPVPTGKDEGREQPDPAGKG